MIQAYIQDDAILKELSIEPSALKPHLFDTVWVDLVNPSLDEKKSIEDILGISIPTREEMYEIELSSRLYQRENTLFTTIVLLTKTEAPHPESTAVTFIIHKKWLITVRYVEDFRNLPIFSKPKINAILAQKSSLVFTAILENITEQLADILELTTHNIEDVSRMIFKYDYATNGVTKKASKPNFREIMSRIGYNEDLLSKTRESLFTISRMLGFIMQTPVFELQGGKRQLSTLLKDISFLIEHATFLSNKINFLLDAALGMINIEQNSIIKIVSVFSVVFLPPMLVASIYGMNFHHMPELNWEYGYPFAVIFTVLAGFLPYKYFKYKNWL